MANITYVSGEKLPKWARGVLVVGSVVIVGYVVYKLSKSKLFKSKTEVEEAAKATVDAVTSEIKSITNQGGANAQLSYPQSTYTALCNFIVTSLNGVESDQTELKVIYEIAKVVKKPLDWLYLVKTFGVRSVEDAGWGSTKYDLPTLLKDQLDSFISVYSIDVNGYKKSGYAVMDSVTILEGYLSSKGINL